MRAFYRRKM